MKNVMDRVIEVRFTVPVTGISNECRAEAERKAREAFVMALLRQGEISAGRAAELLEVDRWRLSDLMSEYGISPFDESLTAEELKREVEDALRDFAAEQ